MCRFIDVLNKCAFTSNAFIINSPIMLIRVFDSSTTIRQIKNRNKTKNETDTPQQ